MKLVNLILLAACFTVAGCSSTTTSNSGTSNTSNAPSANANATTANSNAVNTSATNTATTNNAPTQKSAPDAVVRELYKQHDAENSPFYQTDDRARVDKYFTKRLADLIWQDALSSKREGGVGAIGGDPLYDAQDMEITDFKIQPDQVDGDQALVLVTFKNFGKNYSLIYNVERENGEWKISNITGDNYNLRNNLQAAAKRK